MLVLMPDIENAFLGSGDQPANDHSLNEQMWEVLHDEAIFDCSWFAFIGVADYVLFVIRTVANYLPLVPSWETGASHTAQSARL